MRFVPSGSWTRFAKGACEGYWSSRNWLPLQKVENVLLHKKLLKQYQHVTHWSSRKTCLLYHEEKKNKTTKCLTNKQTNIGWHFRNEPTNKHFCGSRIQLLRRQQAIFSKEKIAQIVRRATDGSALPLGTTYGSATLLETTSDAVHRAKRIIRCGATHAKDSL